MYLHILKYEIYRPIILRKLFHVTINGNWKLVRSIVKITKSGTAVFAHRRMTHYRNLEGIGCALQTSPRGN